MTQMMRFISKVAAIAFAIALARPAESKSLEEFMQIFDSTRAGMEGARRQTAELFASTLGENRRYRYELRLVPALFEKARLFPVQHFLSSFTRLQQSGDADAIVETITKLAPAVSKEELGDADRLAQLVGEIIMPACQEFYLGLESALFGSADFKLALASGQLASEIESQAASQSVRDFLFGWVHQHTCRLLLSADEAFMRRVARRAPDYFKIKDRLAARS